MQPGTMSKFDPARFLIFGLVFVSRDFELGRNVSCEESTVSPVHVRNTLSPFRLSFVWLSVVYLSVPLVHPTQPVEIFGNFSSPFGALAIRRHPRKILRRSSQGNPSVGGV